MMGLVTACTASTACCLVCTSKYAMQRHAVEQHDFEFAMGQSAWRMDGLTAWCDTLCLPTAAGQTRAPQGPHPLFPARLHLHAEGQTMQPLPWARRQQGHWTMHSKALSSSA